MGKQEKLGRNREGEGETDSETGFWVSLYNRAVNFMFICADDDADFGIRC